MWACKWITLTQTTWLCPALYLLCTCWTRCDSHSLYNWSHFVGGPLCIVFVRDAVHKCWICLLLSYLRQLDCALDAIAAYKPLRKKDMKRHCIQRASIRIAVSKIRLFVKCVREWKNLLRMSLFVYVCVLIGESVPVYVVFSFSFDFAIFMLLSKKSEKQNHTLRFGKASSAAKRSVAWIGIFLLVVGGVWFQEAASASLFAANWRIWRGFSHDPESHQTQMCSARKCCYCCCAGWNGMDHGALCSPSPLLWLGCRTCENISRCNWQRD